MSSAAAPTAIGCTGHEDEQVTQALLAQLSAPLRQYLATESGGAGVLLVAVVTALVWANSPWSEAYQSCGRQGPR